MRYQTRRSAGLDGKDLLASQAQAAKMATIS
jgi:hypothetical protein